MVKELDADKLRLSSDPKAFDFETTAELEPLDRIIGQERAIEALKLGLGIKDAKNRYNIYVAGGPGTGKMSAVEHFLSRVSADEPEPPDLCYVHNFENPHGPSYLELPAGMGQQLKEDMDHCISRLKRDIPKVFESDEFKARSKKISEGYTEKRAKLFEGMETKSRELGFALQRTPIGINTLPLREKGEPLSQEEYEALSEEEKAAIREKQGEVQTLIQESLPEIARVEEEREQKINELAKEAVLFMIEPHFNQLKCRYGEIEKAATFLDDVKKNIEENPFFVSIPSARSVQALLRQCPGRQLQNAGGPSNRRAECDLHQPVRFDRAPRADGCRCYRLHDDHAGVAPPCQRRISCTKRKQPVPRRTELGSAENRDQTPTNPD
jgi:hypothetical protein